MNEKIYTSVPIDSTARRVTSEAPNDELKGSYKHNEYMSLVRPPILKSTFSKKEHDLTGKKFGKFTVIGLFIYQNPKKKSKWVVQCKCGYYTSRVGVSIRRAIENKETDHECRNCQYVSNLSKPRLNEA